MCLFGEVLEISEVRLCLGHDPFGDLLVLDVVFITELVEELVASDAEAGLEGICWIVEAGVDHFAVAGTVVKKYKLTLAWYRRTNQPWIRTEYNSFMNLVSWPAASFLSTIKVDPPRAASLSAIARPTTPAPMTR